MPWSKPLILRLAETPTLCLLVVFSGSEGILSLAETTGRPHLDRAKLQEGSSPLESQEKNGI